MTTSTQPKPPGKQTLPLVYRVKTPRGWREFMSPRRRQGRAYVRDKGQECHYPGGRYFLKYWHHGKRRFEPLNLTPPSGVIVAPNIMQDMITNTVHAAQKRLAKRLADLQATQASSPTYRTTQQRCLRPS